MNMSVELDITIGANNYLQIQVETSSLSPYGISTVIYQIPSSYTVIQNTTVNEFINPPTSQMTYLSIRNNIQGVVSFINGGSTPNPWRMCLTNTNYNMTTGGSISFVFAPNTSTPSYFDISKTALYKINIVYDQYVPTIGGVNTYFNVNLYNITDSTIVAFCPVYYNNINTSINQCAVISGIYTLETGKSYDVRLNTPQNTSVFTQVQRFSLDLVEFIPLYA